MRVILKICPGEVLLSPPVTAFRLLREFFSRCDWIAYLVPIGCSFLWLLLATPSAISFPQRWPTQPVLAFARSPFPVPLWASPSVPRAPCPCLYFLGDCPLARWVTCCHSAPSISITIFCSLCFLSLVFCLVNIRLWTCKDILRWKST